MIFFFANTVKYWSTIWHSTHITTASNLKYFRKYTIIWNLFSMCKVQRKSKNNSQFLRFVFFKKLYLWLTLPGRHFWKTLLFEDTRRRDPIWYIILRYLMLVKILEWSKFVQNKISESFDEKGTRSSVPIFLCSLLSLVYIRYSICCKWDTYHPSRNLMCVW